MLIGTYVLMLFGISLPVVRIGGGLLVAATAWRMLHHTEDDDVHAVAAHDAAMLSDAEIVQRSFVPITFPLTTGPGTGRRGRQANVRRVSAVPLARKSRP